jgi:polysaccharide biosynthesis/export protein
MFAENTRAPRPILIAFSFCLITLPAGCESANMPANTPPVSSDLNAAKTDTPERLGPNDQITLYSEQVTELSGKSYRIGPDGLISLPLLGDVQAQGKTVRDLETGLSEQLKHFYVAPQVTVAVSEVRSQPVSLSGAVNNPGIHQLQGRHTLLEMLSSAGGLRSDAGPVLTITRRTDCGAVPIPNTKEDVAAGVNVGEINIRDLMAASDPGLNVSLCPGDVVTVPRAEVVYVLGEVHKSGGFQLGEHASMTTLEAVSLAEGLQPKAASSHAYILRTSSAGAKREEIPVDLRKIMAGKSKDLPLYQGDILVVPNSAAKSAAMRSLEVGVQIATGLIIFH